MQHTFYNSALYGVSVHHHLVACDAIKQQIGHIERVQLNGHGVVVLDGRAVSKIMVKAMVIGVDDDIEVAINVADIEAAMPGYRGHDWVPISVRLPMEAEARHA